MCYGIVVAAARLLVRISIVVAALTLLGTWASAAARSPNRPATLGVSASAAARSPKRAALAGTPVPLRFVGINASGPLLGANVNLGQQLDQMVASGVETVRVVFDWAAAQPYASLSDVPADQQNDFVDVGGIPTDFATTDEMVGLAAQRGLTVLPTVLYAPSWDQGMNPGGRAAPPARTGPYANYVTALIDRRQTGARRVQPGCARDRALPHEGANRHELREVLGSGLLASSPGGRGLPIPRLEGCEQHGV